jgi:hypothetical protein
MLARFKYFYGMRSCGKPLVKALYATVEVGLIFREHIMPFQSLVSVVGDRAYPKSISRRLFLGQMLLLTACGAKTTQSQVEELVI